MSIPVPNLDDRSFLDLVEAARARIRQVDPEWTDLSVHDPGVVLVEAFAHLTDLLLYRLNRVPEKLYAVYLNLLGTAVRPPGAAEVMLEFSRTAADGPEVRIPRGTQVSTPPGVPGAPVPVFSTTADALLGEGESSVAVAAVDATVHDAVLLGLGTGRPGQSFALPATPAVAGEGLGIGIEVQPGAPLASGEAVLIDDRAFRFCREVDAFVDAEPGEAVVRVDRTSGTVIFPWWSDADAQPPVVPSAGAQVRAWYRSGGGARGNVPAGALTVLRSGVSGIRVSNPAAATGGRDVEALEDALRRAPQDFQARDRAVTARDYEVLAERHGGVARARALTRREVWSFAEPGEVEVVLVPARGASPERPRADEAAAPTDHAPSDDAPSDDVLRDVADYLRARATIGATPVVRWALDKRVLVEARVVIRADEDEQAVEERIVRRLRDAISPVPGGAFAYASDFGRPLRVSNLYRALEEAEPGVQYVDAVAIEVEQVPDADAVGLVRAEGQEATWFVAQSDTLFRTTNAGDGWEAVAGFPGEVVRAIAPFGTASAGGARAPRFPGMVAVCTDHGEGARVYVSRDLGESWERRAELGFGLADMAWVERAAGPALLLAGDKGLYELADAAGAVPVQNVVNPLQPDQGFAAVESFIDLRGQTGVIVSAEAGAGIWLSPTGGTPESFDHVRASGEEIRCLAVQYDGPATYLWIGRAVPEGAGTGCARLRIDELARTDFGSGILEKWEELRQGWAGGTCWKVHVVGQFAYAATQSGGVLRMRLGSGSQLAWEQPDVNCGLPLRDRARFEPVRSVSGALDDSGAALVLASGPVGVYRSRDGESSWSSCTRRLVHDVVTLPPTWLFSSGQHRIEVVRSHG